MSGDSSSLNHNILGVQPRAATFESFTLFPKLPVEVRLKIWRLSFPNNRKLELHFVIINPFDILLAAVSTNPAALYVNQESREETLRFYEEAFHGIGDGTIYLNPDSDTVLFTPERKRNKKLTSQKYGYVYRDTMAMVQQLEIDQTDYTEYNLLNEILQGVTAMYQDVMFNDIFNEGDEGVSFLGFFPNLKKLKIVESESRLPKQRVSPVIGKVKDCYQNDPGRFDVEKFFNNSKLLLENEKRDNSDFHIPDIELEVMCDCRYRKGLNISVNNRP
jgi:hypothetical protein